MQSQTTWIINQYASTPDSGMGGRHYVLARELARQGHRVYLVAAGFHHYLRKPPQLAEAVSIEPRDGFNFVWIRMPAYDGAHDKRRIGNWLRFAWQLTRLPRAIEEKPDVILCSSPSLFAILGARRLANRFNARLVFEVRDIWPLSLVELGGYSPRHPFIRFAQWVEDYAYRVSDKVVSNLPLAVEHMVTRGMDRSKFVWIPNGYSSDETERAEPLSEAVLAQLPKGKFVVGYAGTFGHANALDSLIEAAALLADDPDIAVVLVGSGREKQSLLAQAATMGLSSLHVLDPIPKSQIPSLLSRFDVCYIGLKDEPLFRFGVSPNKLFDYLVAARPVLYAINSGNRPVDDAGCGISVPAEEAAAIAHGIRQLKALRAERREEMGRNGRYYAERHHDYAVLARRLLDEALTGG